MPRDLATLDVVIIVLYVVGTTLLGALFTRGQRNVTTYFVGDRNVSWWLVLVSIVATETSTVTFLSVPGIAFQPGGNLAFLQLSIGYVIGRSLIAWLLLPQYMQGNWLSAYQLLRLRFSPAVQRAASGLFLLTRTIADGLRLYLTALLLNAFTGWDMEWSIAAMSAVTLVYTYLGGMQAVIWTDLIQFVIYIAGALFAGFWILHLLPGGIEQYVEAGRATGKFRVLDFSFDLTRAYTFWTGVIGGACFTMASHGADQLMVQRYLCSRSLTAARVALVASGFTVLVQFLLFLLIGVGLFVLHQEAPLPRTEADQVFASFIVRDLPRGLVGLVIAAVLAAAMSTLSSSLNSSSTAFVTDFYRPLRSDRGEAHYLNVSRGMTIFWGCAQMTVALVTHRAGSGRSVIDQVLSVAGFTTGMVLGLFLLGSLRRVVASRSALLGLVVGFVTVFLVWLPSAFTKPEEWPGLARTPLHYWKELTGLKAPLAWPWYAPIGTLVTVVVALLVDRLLRRGHGSSANRSSQPRLDAPR